MYLNENNLNKSSRRGVAETNLTSIHEDVGSIPGLTSGSEIWHCYELWCRSQMHLGSVAVAVAAAGSCSFDFDHWPWNFHML